jgi:hypothetical protein
MPSNCPNGFWCRIWRDRLRDEQRYHASKLRQTAADLSEASGLVDRLTVHFGLGERLRSLVNEAAPRGLNSAADFLEGETL